MINIKSSSILDDMIINIPLHSFEDVIYFVVNRVFSSVLYTISPHALKKPATYFGYFAKEFLVNTIYYHSVYFVINQNIHDRNMKVEEQVCIK